MVASAVAADAAPSKMNPASIVWMSMGTAASPSTVFGGGARWKLVAISRTSLRGSCASL
jgi:hypothetical protein